MAITPIENVIHVNQNMHLASNLSSKVQNRFDLQNIAAMMKANEKKEEDAKIRPTEETHNIDPENEHEKQKLKDELDEHKKRKEAIFSSGKRREEEEEEEESYSDSTILDLKA